MSKCDNAAKKNWGKNGHFKTEKLEKGGTKDMG